MVIYKGATHYRGWYTELEEAEGDADGEFVYSPKGYTTNELGMAWFQKCTTTLHHPSILQVSQHTAQPPGPPSADTRCY